MIDHIDELLNNAPCGFLSFTDDGAIAMVNNTLLKLLEYELDELLAKKIELILPIASRIFYQTHFFPLLKLHGNVEEIYFSLKSKQGKNIPVLVNAVRQKTAENVLNNCIFIAIHQRIKYEDEILKAKKESELATIAQKQAEIELRELYLQLQIELKERQWAEQIILKQTEREILLRKMTQSIYQSLDITIIFEIAVREIRQYFQSDRVGIFQFSPNCNFEEGQFISESVAPGFNSAIGIKVYEHCFSEKYVDFYQQGKIHSIENINTAGFQKCHIDILKKFDIQANLVAPLLKKDELWGLLCVHQCSNSRCWQEFEIYFIQQVANQLAIAIQQANLFEQVQTELFERRIVESKLKETNQSLSIANIELANATKAKSEFLANMSHEIRTPMNGIIGMAQLLSMSNLSEEQRDFLDTIRDSGDALITIINDILDFSKIESGMLELEEHPFKLRYILKSVCNLFIKQTSDKGINLSYKIDNNVPDTLLGDGSRLRQIILNLVGNALKFTTEGSVYISVKTRKQEDQKVELMISIQDTGIGIDSDRLKKLFQPFTQADASISRKYGGTGLGLAISKSLVALMGGTIWVETLGNIGGIPPQTWISDLENSKIPGSIFHFTLIIKVTDESKINLEQIPEKSYIEENNLQSQLTILLAEDNKVNQKVAIFTLKKLGYMADIANNGLEVLEKLEKQVYDIILMDMQMPEMDGVTTTKIIRQSTKPQPYIIALTANALEEDRQTCLDIGMNDYISKPIAIAKLKEALKNAALKFS